MIFSDGLAVAAILLAVYAASRLIRKNRGKGCGSGCEACPYAKECAKRLDIKSKERGK